ncbi:MAG: hypothetical protein ACERKD_24890 [Prolixibacteraceae bacterium]
MTLIGIWVPKLIGLDKEMLTQIENAQNRTIPQILGHMVDSASNNTHRMIHLQYQESPFAFPNYASHGNNDRWIAIQNYKQEEWINLVQLWKYVHLHFIHVSNQVDNSKLDQQWIAGDDELISLKQMGLDFLRHFKLHLAEIEDQFTIRVEG